MRHAFIADPHFGNHRIHGGVAAAGLNRRFRQICDVFKLAVAHARGTGARTLTVLGDTYDNSYPTPQQQTAVMDVVQHLAGPMRVHFILGNHDRNSILPGDHALGPTGYVASIHADPAIVGDDQRLGLLPFKAQNPLEYINEQCSMWWDMGQRPTVLGGHFGIYDDAALRGAHWIRDSVTAIHRDRLADGMDKFGLQVLVAGDWHGHQVWEYPDRRTIVQCGALVPTGWDNPGLDGYGTVVVVEIDDDRAELVEVLRIPGPRFLEVTSEAEIAEARASCMADQPLYIRWTVLPEEVEAAGQLAPLIVERDGFIEALDVLTDRRNIEARIQAATDATRQQSTLQQAAQMYLDQIPLEAHEDRDAVSGHVLRFLELTP